MSSTHIVEIGLKCSFPVEGQHAKHPPSKGGYDAASNQNIWNNPRSTLDPLIYRLNVCGLNRKYS